MLLDALIGSGTRAEQARDRLREVEVPSAPHLVDLEVANTLHRLVASRRLEVGQARAALADFLSMRLQRFPHTALLERIWELRGSITPYDAAYVALAETLDCPLVTSDAKLARAGKVRCVVEVLRAG